jgi:hypothetical protein
VIKIEMKNGFGQMLDIFIDTITGKQVVLKQDFSCGIFSHYAVIGRQGYAQTSGAFSWYEIREVIDRAGPRRVYVEAFHVSEHFYFRSPVEALQFMKEQKFK